MHNNYACAFDVEAIAREYLQENCPPEEILNLGIHGSASRDTRPHSDIDFYCICKNDDNQTLRYVRKFIHNINKKTGRWAEMMLCTLDNKGVFEVNPFTAMTLRGSLNLYGDHFEGNVEIVTKNDDSDGLTPIEYSFIRFKGYGLKCKKNAINLNDDQLLVSFPAFAKKHIIYTPEQAVKMRAMMVAKCIISACAFANTTFELAEGVPFKFSKVNAPESFRKYFNMGTNLPEMAREIYYQDSASIDLIDFAEEKIFDWLLVQKEVEKILREKIRQCRLEDSAK